MSLKSLNSARNFVFDIFTQGKWDYIHTINQEIAANFIYKGAVLIKSEDLDKCATNTKNIHGPQKEMKALAIKLLKKRGFKVLAIEKGFNGGIVDVLGGRGKERIAVECGPCRISKFIDYLWRENTALWVIKPAGNKYILYEFKRGEWWNKAIELYEKMRKEELERHRVIVNKAFEDFE